MLVEEPKLAKNRGLAGKHIAEIAKAQGKHPVDAFLDLAVEENLETVFSLGEINMDTEAVAQILGSPRSEEHTSELQSLTNLVCRLLLEKKKNKSQSSHG